MFRDTPVIIRGEGQCQGEIVEMRNRTELRDLAAVGDRLDLKRWTVWREGGRNPLSIQRSITGSMIFMLTL